MNLYLRLGVPALTVAATAVLGAMTTGSATAAEFCRQDVTGHMSSCGYSSMEQCQAASAGIGGDCFRDPNLGASNPGNAFAHASKAAHVKKEHRKAVNGDDQ